MQVVIPEGTPVTIPVSKFSIKLIFKIIVSIL